LFFTLQPNKADFLKKNKEDNEKLLPNNVENILEHKAFLAAILFSSYFPCFIISLFLHSVNRAGELFFMADFRHNCPWILSLWGEPSVGK
jgi:hypothetical protein